MTRIIRIATDFFITIFIRENPRHQCEASAIFLEDHPRSIRNYGENHMTCNDVRGNLAAYLHGELEKKALMVIHQHLADCEACVQQEIELRRTERLLDQFQFEALLDNFDEQLHQKIIKIEKPVVQTKRDFRRIVYAIAATILIMIGVQFFGSRFLKSTKQPIHFKDFPTTQAVFKSELSQQKSETSLKERLIERHLKANKNSAMKIMREF
jgi:hypothetical protein